MCSEGQNGPVDLLAAAVLFITRKFGPLSGHLTDRALRCSRNAGGFNTRKAPPKACWYCSTKSAPSIVASYSKVRSRIPHADAKLRAEAASLDLQLTLRRQIALLTHFLVKIHSWPTNCFSVIPVLGLLIGSEAFKAREVSSVVSTASWNQTANAVWSILICCTYRWPLAVTRLMEKASAIPGGADKKPEVNQPAKLSVEEQEKVVYICWFTSKCVSDRYCLRFLCAEGCTCR